MRCVQVYDYILASLVKYRGMYMDMAALLRAGGPHPDLHAHHDLLAQALPASAGQAGPCHHLFMPGNMRREGVGQQTFLLVADLTLCAGGARARGLRRRGRRGRAQQRPGRLRSAPGRHHHRGLHRHRARRWAAGHRRAGALLGRCCCPLFVHPDVPPSAVCVHTVGHPCSVYGATAHANITCTHAGDLGPRRPGQTVCLTIDAPSVCGEEVYG